MGGWRKCNSGEAIYFAIHQLLKATQSIESIYFTHPPFRPLNLRVAANFYRYFINIFKIIILKIPFLKEKYRFFTQYTSDLLPSRHCQPVTRKNQDHLHIVIQSSRNRTDQARTNLCTLMWRWGLFSLIQKQYFFIYSRKYPLVHKKMFLELF